MNYLFGKTSPDTIRGRVKKVIFNRKLTCNICGREIFDGGNFCDECLKTIKRNDGHICDHCGAPLPYPAAFCDSCANRNLSFSFMRSAFVYTGGVKRVITGLKYGGKLYLSDVLAEEIFDLYLKTGYSADIVAYVPMVKSRERKRGYNQSEAIADGFCRLAGLPLAVGAIEKKENSASQVGLTRDERRRNLEGSFRIADKSVFKGKKVVLIDDVATTGSTAEVISALVARAGAADIAVFTAAVTAKKVRSAKDGTPEGENNRKI